MKSRLIVCLFVISIFLLGITTAFAAEKAKAVNYEKYISPNDKYSVSFPKDWKLRNDIQDVSIIAISPSEGPDDKFYENFNIIIGDYQEDLKLDDYFNMSVDVCEKNLKEFKVLKTDNMLIQGKIPVKKMVYVHTAPNGLQIKANAYVFFVNRKGYALTGSALPKTHASYDATFDKIAKSFKFE
jgi:hypothetical protein